MSSTGTRLELDDARELAWAFVEAHCVGGRVEIVGSIRRRKETVGDIELLLHRDTQLVGVDADYGEESMFPSTAAYQWIKRGEKYGQLLHKARGYKIDLFRADDDNWGSIMLIRTGPSDFSARWVTALKQRGTPSAGGYIRDKDGAVIPCRDEAMAFQLTGWDYIEPESRC